MISANIHRRISLNSLANLIRYAVYVVVTFIMTPYTIRKLGLDDYGLWVLVLAIVGYGGLLELGVQTSVIKLVAQKNAANDQDGLQRIVSTAYAFFQMAGLLIACVLILIAYLFVSRMVSYPEQHDVVRLLFVILGINTAICFPSYVLGGVIYGMQRYVAKSCLDVFLAVTNAGLTFMVLEQGRGIVGLAMVKMIVDIASIFVLFLLTRKILPRLRIRFKEVSVASFRELFSLGGKIFISSTTTRIATNTEPVIVSAILSNAWTTIFSVPKRMVEYVRAISMAATTGFMPMFSDLKGRGDTGQIAQLYDQYTRYILMMVIPFISCIMVLGVPFIRLWIGDEMAIKSGNLIYYLSVAFLIQSLEPLIARLLIGVGKVNFLVAVSSIGAMGYLLLGALLVYFYGIDGIGVSSVVISLLYQVFYIPYVCRYLKVSMMKHVIYCQVRPVVSWCVVSFCLYLVTLISDCDSYFKIIVACFIGFLLYGIICYFYVLIYSEKKFIINKLKNYAIALSTIRIM